MLLSPYLNLLYPPKPNHSSYSLQEFLSKTVDVKKAVLMEHEVLKCLDFNIDAQDTPCRQARELVLAWPAGPRHPHLDESAAELISNFLEGEISLALSSSTLNPLDCHLVVKESSNFSALAIGLTSVLLAIAQEDILSRTSTSAQLDFMNCSREFLARTRKIQLGDLNLEKCLDAFNAMPFLPDVRRSSYRSPIKHLSPPPLQMKETTELSSPEGSSLFLRRKRRVAKVSPEGEDEDHLHKKRRD